MSVSAFAAWTKTLTLAITFKPLKIEISYEYSIWQDLSHGTISFDLVTLTLKFDLLFKNFNLGHNFQIGSRALIFHVCIGIFNSPKYDVNPQPYTRGIGPLVGRTSGNRCSVMCVLALIDRIAKQVGSMNWRKLSVRLSVRLSGVNNLRLAVAFSLVSLKALMIHKSNLVSLLTLMSSSRQIQNLMTLTLTSRFSEHTLILTLPCSLSHH